MKTKGMSGVSILGVIAITVALVAGLVYMGGAKTRRFEKLTSREVALLCTTDMATQFHIHPELTIIINGQQMTIPENIGITPSCMNSIHTHEEPGVLHVESPIQKDFTLGDFFAVWKKPFDSTHILDKTADVSNVITVTVNGEPVETFENTVLVDKDKIVITYGPKK